MALAIFLSLFTSPIWGQDLHLNGKTDRTSMHLGDRLTLTLTLSDSGDRQIQWPTLDKLGDFEVLGRTVLEHSAEELPAVRYELTCFKLGEIEIPAVEVTWTQADGSAGRVASDPITIRLESTAPEAPAEQPGQTPEQPAIREIKPPEEIPRDWLRLAAWAAGVLAAAALAYWLYRRLRSRKSAKGPQMPAVPARPPHEVALEALEALEKSGLIEQGEIKEFHVRIADIMRIYFEGKFGVDALEMTTEEVLTHLTACGVKSDPLSATGALLRRCDLVKFAKLRPDAEACRRLLPKARDIVKGTIPPPAAPALPGQAPTATAALNQPAPEASAMADSTGGTAR